LSRKFSVAAEASDTQKSPKTMAQRALFSAGGKRNRRRQLPEERWQLALPIKFVGENFGIGFIYGNYELHKKSNLSESFFQLFFKKTVNSVLADGFPRRCFKGFRSQSVNNETLSLLAEINNLQYQMF
jgi:hypothetical protein